MSFLAISSQQGIVINSDPSPCVCHKKKRHFPKPKFDCLLSRLVTSIWQDKMDGSPCVLKFFSVVFTFQDSVLGCFTFVKIGDTNNILCKPRFDANRSRDRSIGLVLFALRVYFFGVLLFYIHKYSCC